MEARTQDVELNRWMSRWPGRVLARLEYVELRRTLRPLRGRQRVIDGSVLDVAKLTQVGTFQHDFQLAHARHSRGNAVGEAHLMPLQADSVDTLVLPHSLELSANPHAVIREAHRVLAPEGHLVISGFNPWSLAGVAKAASRRKMMPWSPAWVSAGRVQDWMALLGFEMVNARHEWLRRVSGWFVGASESWHPIPFVSGVYVLVARKKILWVRPIVSRWRARPTLAPAGLAEPSARATGND
jgi:SAM-dependent methyltransferase